MSPFICTSSTQPCSFPWLRNKIKEDVVLKSVRHFRLRNERGVLRRFQSRTPYVRPLLDDIEESSHCPTPPAIILKYLDVSNAQRLTRPEVKYVARGVLEALATLHDDGFVHTDVKASNIPVNYDSGNIWFKDVQLADFGSTVHADSGHPREGDEIGTPMFRSPEAHLQMRWGTATDIRSFAAMIISLLYGEGFHIFKPDVPVGHDEYEIKILFKHHRCFGPFPASYQEIADEPPRRSSVDHEQ